MSLFRLLRKINHSLKCVAVSEAIGMEILIDISKDEQFTGNELKKLVEEQFALKVKCIKNSNLKGTIAKYGIVDLNLELEKCDELHSKGGLQLLRENGWATEENDEQFKEEALEFLQDMLKEIEEGKIYLKVYATSIHQKKKWPQEKSYLMKQLLSGGSLQPRPEDRIQVFKIRDMCYTNYSGIWLWKYFYM